MINRRKSTTSRSSSRDSDSRGSSRGSSRSSNRGSDSRDSGSRGSEKKGNWAVFGTRNDGKYGDYIKVSDYKGTFFYECADTGKTYVIKSIGIFEPDNKAPKFVLESYRLNLDNEKSAELLEDNN